MTHIVYVVGLEHSGTTLLTHLLSGFPKTIGLGEVFNFLNPIQLENYHSAWGQAPEAYLCSCGRIWDKCEFWGKLSNVRGDSCTSPILERYYKIIRFAETVFGDNVTLVDSSKNLDFLFAAQNHLQHTRPDIRITALHIVKDVRSFAASITNKNNSCSKSPLQTLRSFNWWAGEVLRTNTLLERSEIPSSTVLYNDLAIRPMHTLRKLGSILGLNYTHYSTSTNSSHIAIGNKRFTLHTLNEITYDTNWHFNNSILLIYLIHARARLLNERLHS